MYIWKVSPLCFLPTLSPSSLATACRCSCRRGSQQYPRWTWSRMQGEEADLRRTVRGVLRVHSHPESNLASCDGGQTSTSPDLRRPVSDQPATLIPKPSSITDISPHRHARTRPPLRSRGTQPHHTPIPDDRSGIRIHQHPPRAIPTLYITRRLPALLLHRDVGVDHGV